MKRRAPAMTRDRAMAARPVQVPPLATEARNGKLYVTLAYERPRWQRLLGADSRCSRAYGLDAYGREVYEACDGRRTVAAIARCFAEAHALGVAEAEAAVTTFLQTLMSRGLVGMAIGEDTP